jgi:glycosyltransferase involved in cell wall biosynthesis
MSLRVIMFPAVGNRNENRYIDILVAALRRAGVTVLDWQKHFSLQAGDIFHIHWPDLIADIRKRPFQRIRGDAIFWNFLATVRRVKRAGGKVAWTVHDLRPHDADIDRQTFNARVMSGLLDAVDLVFSLTESGKAQIVEAMPGLLGRPVELGRHPHCREVLPSTTRSEDTCRRLGIGRSQRVLSFLGTMRPDKRPDLLATAFAGLSSSDSFLIMAGACSGELAAVLSNELAAKSNRYLRLTSLSQAELHGLYGVTDVSVFPASSYFNSGTIYTSLSLNVPVIAARTQQTLEVQRLVGEGWLHLYDGSLSADVLWMGLSRVVDRSLGLSCDLSAFDPDLCARQHIDAYERVLK